MVTGSDLSSLGEQVAGTDAGRTGPLLMARPEEPERGYAGALVVRDGPGHHGAARLPPPGVERAPVPFCTPAHVRQPAATHRGRHARAVVTNREHQPVGAND